MKKTIALAVAGILAFSLAVFTPQPLGADEIGRCFENHQTCRGHALDMDAPWYVVMLFLSVCDVALAACILAV